MPIGTFYEPQKRNKWLLITKKFPRILQKHDVIIIVVVKDRQGKVVYDWLSSSLCGSTHPCVVILARKKFICTFICWNFVQWTPSSYYDVKLYTRPPHHHMELLMVVFAILQYQGLPEALLFTSSFSWSPYSQRVISENRTGGHSWPTTTTTRKKLLLADRHSSLLYTHKLIHSMNDHDHKLLGHCQCLCGAKMFHKNILLVVS